MKKSPIKAGLIRETEKDEGTGPWLNVSCPDDLFKYNFDIDFAKLNYKPLFFNCDTLNSPCCCNNNGLLFLINGCMFVVFLLNINFVPFLKL